MKRGPLFCALGASALLAAPMLLKPGRHLVWNASASLPTGLYLIRGKASLHVGERVALEPPPALARLMAERGYLAAGLPLLKRVAAVSGQTVCRFGHGVTIDGRFAAPARARDSRGRALPAWFGCLRLHHGEIFLLNPDAPDSFDGRYFGPVPLRRIIGRAVPLWTDEPGAGGHILFAPMSGADPASSQERTRP